MYEQDLALNNLERLICHKTLTIHSKHGSVYIHEKKFWKKFFGSLIY